jgi:hypothetical protein
MAKMVGKWSWWLTARVVVAALVLSMVLQLVLSVRLLVGVG